MDEIRALVEGGPVFMLLAGMAILWKALNDTRAELKENNKLLIDFLKQTITNNERAANERLEIFKSVTGKTTLEAVSQLSWKTRQDELEELRKSLK
jgi:hypothetical protein